MLYAAFGMYHAENIKLFKLYVVKNVRVVLYKIIYIYINVNIKRLLLKGIQKTQYVLTVRTVY